MMINNVKFCRLSFSVYLHLCYVTWIELYCSFIWREIIVFVQHKQVSKNCVSFCFSMKNINNEGKSYIFDRFSKMATSIEPEKRNIEIKARLADDAAYEKRVAIAKQLTNTDGMILNQRDVFYKVNNGRLKLRMEV